MRQYNVGDTISIDVELKDESGIQNVEMVFQLRVNTDKIIRMPAYGPSQSGVFTLSYVVAPDTAPGEYFLTAFYAIDTNGNRADYPLSSDYNFQIINTPVDLAGPELVRVTVK